jgi:hypothetical protein
MNAALLPDLERVQGSEHPHTLTTRHQIAYFAGQAGDPVAARDLYAALVLDLKRVLGSEHPVTLVTRSHLAHWTGRAGDRAAARDLYAALLPDLERVLGPVHPATLASRRLFTYWRGEAGGPIDILDRIDSALAEVEQQVPEWYCEPEDRDGLVRWPGSVDAMIVRFGLRDHGTPDGEPIGFRQADLIRYVMYHPGCSLNAATAAADYGLHHRYRGAYALQRRDVLVINRDDRRRYRLYVTADGERALAAYLGSR